MTAVTTQPSAATAFGVDIGGSGIKGAPVDLATGQLATERLKVPTPVPSSLANITGAVCRVIEHFDPAPDSPVGLTFPGVVFDGVIGTSANLDDELIGVNLASEVEARCGRRISLVNDADAAGFAEVAYGAAKGFPGSVLVLTLGTGIGSALIVDGRLVPNTELGHLELDGCDAETRAAASAREREDLSWKAYATRLQRYLAYVEWMLAPDLFVIGGGISRDHKKFLHRLSLRAKVVPADLRNTAGIVGAAALAVQRLS